MQLIHDHNSVNEGSINGLLGSRNNCHTQKYLSCQDPFSMIYTFPRIIGTHGLQHPDAESQVTTNYTFNLLFLHDVDCISVLLSIKTIDQVKSGWFAKT